MSGYEPTDIANEALDAVGSPDVLGDITDGSREGNLCLRKYRQCLSQLLRAVQWDFARSEEPLVLLADATGNTPNVGMQVVGANYTYEYSYPQDCMQVRYIQWCPQGQRPGVPANNIAIPNTPLMTGLGQAPFIGTRPRPAPFLITSDKNYLPPPGQQTWEVQGISPVSRTVILTNVQNARCVYTALQLYPSTWDSLFRGAFVAYLASEIALPIWTTKDRKFGLQVQSAQIALTKTKITEARIRDGNEGFSKTDLFPDWIRARNTGGAWNGAGPYGGGDWGGGCGYSAASFGDGSSF